MWGVRDWDLNSRIFLRDVNNKKVNTMISKLERVNEEVVEEEEKIMEEIVDYFRNLYLSSSGGGGLLFRRP